MGTTSDWLLKSLPSMYNLSHHRAVRLIKGRCKEELTSKKFVTTVTTKKVYRQLSERY